MSSSISDFDLSKNVLVKVGATLPKYIVFTDGKLSPAIPSESYSMPQALVVGDINNDNLEDIVVTYGDTYLTPQFYLSNGDGSFSLMEGISSEAARRHIRNAFLTDLNNDGFLDYIGFCAPHGMHSDVLGANWDFDEPDLIMINQAGKAFKIIQNLKEGFNHGGHFGDLNNDALVDIFGLPEWPTGVTWADSRVPFIQSKSLNFEYSKIGLPSWFDTYMTSDIRIGDINNDGLNDYVIALAPRPQNIGGPLGTPMESTLENTIAFAYGDGSLNIDKLDWNKVGTHWMTAELWQSYIVQNAPNLKNEEITGSGPSNIELLDVNADGLLDVLVGLYISPRYPWTTSGFIYLENTGGGFLDKTDTVFPNQSSNRSIVDPTSFMLGFELVDLNGDGNKDLVLTQKSTDGVPSGRGPASFTIFINENGVFYPVNQKTIEFNINGRPQFGLVSAGDVNGDGVPDLISIGDGGSNFNLVTYLNSTDLRYENANTVDGTSSNDFIKLPEWGQARGMAGDDQIIGSRGTVESAVYYGALADFKITNSDALQVNLVSKMGNEGDDALTDIERVKFSDVTVALDIGKGQNAGEAYRLYKAAFDRLPDNEGLGYWINAFDHGADLTSVASSFIASPEFAAMYGANSTDTNFVTLLYKHVLHRDPDAEGNAYWLNALQNGMSRGSVLASFSESPENIAQTAPLIANGIQYQEWIG